MLSCIHMGSMHLNSCPFAWVTSPLSTMPFPWSSFLFLFFFHPFPSLSPFLFEGTRQVSNYILTITLAVRHHAGCLSHMGSSSLHHDPRAEMLSLSSFIGVWPGELAQFLSTHKLQSWCLNMGSLTPQSFQGPIVHCLPSLFL